MARFVAQIIASTARNQDELQELLVENDQRLARGEHNGEEIAIALQERERELAALNKESK